MRDKPPPTNQSPPGDDLDPESYTEPAFNLRRGLRLLIVIGVIVTVISVICIAIDGRYS